MHYHILNGDALNYTFPEACLEGEVIIAREALIEGDLSGQDLPDFWRSRAAFLGVTDAEYRERTVNEFEKIRSAPAGSTFHLWFEYDLFCQVNSWFVLSLIHERPAPATVYAVHTSHLDRSSPHFWNGFGPANAAQLRVCFAERTLLSRADIQLGHHLWTAFKHNDFDELIRLSDTSSPAFPYLQEVVQAHVDRFPTDGTVGRPERVIAGLIKSGTTGFTEVCREFWKRESIYGFGDTQLRRLYDKVCQDTGDSSL